MGRGRVQRPQSRLQCLQGRRLGQIGLGDEQTVGHGCLLYGLYLAIQGVCTIGGIDGRYDSIKTILPRHRAISHQGMENGRGIGQPCRFDHNPVEPSLAPPGKTPRRIAQRFDQVTPDRAAQTAAGHFNDHVIVTVGNQIMINPDLAELVDEHKSAAEFRLVDQVIENRRLAAAQEPRQDRNGQALRRSS